VVPSAFDEIKESENSKMQEMQRTRCEILRKELEPDQHLSILVVSNSLDVISLGVTCLSFIFGNF
jgi:hypothetical protein